MRKRTKVDRAVAARNIDLDAIIRFVKALNISCEVYSAVLRRDKYGEPVAFKIIVAGIDEEASRSVMDFANRLGIALEIKK